MANFLSEFLKFADKELSFPAGVIMDLPNEDDWSFIIKISAVAERSLNKMLTAPVKEDSYKELVIRQTLENKVTLAKDLGIIQGSDQSKLKTMGRLRNRAAHNILFSFEGVFNADGDLLNAYRSAFGDVWNDPLTVASRKVPALKFIVENPRITILMGILGGLSEANLETEMKKLKDDQSRIDEIIAKFSSGSP